MAFLLARSAALLAILFLLPIVIGDFWAFQLGLYYLYAIAALGVGICWGHAGFLPLGQATFFGLGAYLGGFSMIYLGDSLLLWPALIGAAIAPAILAYLIGMLAFRGRTESGPYFALITVAITLLAFQIANSWNSLTGGYNGLKNIPGLPGASDFEDIYFVAAAALAFGIGLTALLIHTPLGVLWRGLAQNERRVAFFGFDASLLKTLAFAASGMLAGIAGALYAPQQGIVTPELCGFLFSADLVISAAVGGRAVLLGPVVGTVLVGILAAQLRDVIGYWEIIVAAIFIVVVLHIPNGLIGLAAPLARLVPASPRPAGEPATPRSLAASPASLTIKQASAAVGEVQILDALSLDIDRPGINCIIGPNGAGKTSVFNMLTGELAAQHAEVELDGEPIRDLSAHRMALRGVGRKFQIPSVFANLSIADNLHIALWGGRASILDLLRPSLRRWTSPLLDTLQRRFPFLTDDSRPAGSLSHDERQILELVMALIAEPRLLLLDEPCGGLSAEETQQVIDVIRWARDNLALTIVIIEHDMVLVKALAEHVFVMHQGKLLAEGDVPTIQHDPRVREVYVGVTE